MNLREIAADRSSLKVLQAKLRKQSLQIEQLKEENQWLREQLAKAIERVDKKQKPFYKRK